MQPTVYLLGQLVIILLVLGLLSMLLYGMRHALARLRVGAQNRRLLIGFTLAGLILWLAILALMAFAGYFRRFDTGLPRWLLAMGPPVIVVAVLLFSKKLRLLLLALPAAWLIYAQTFRILVELFYYLGCRAGYVPPQMTFAWLNFDIIVGITAPMAGYVFFGRNRYHRFQAIYWNVFGVALLLNNIMVAALSTPSSIRVFMNEPAGVFLADFPFVWIPGFIVPFALALHLFSLKQLIFTKPAQRRFSLRRGRERRKKGNAS